MNFILGILQFVLGSMVGSFAGVVVMRLGEDKPGIISGRSECPHCGKVLGAAELIPIWSYIIQGGRCKSCGEKIDVLHLLMEIIMGLMFILGWAHSPTLLSNIWLDAILAILVVISFFDLKYQMIPDAFSYAGIGLAILDWLLGFGNEGMFWGALMFFIFFGLQVWVSREKWLGFGDLILGIFLGLLVGYPLVWLNLMLSYMLGAVVGVSLIAGGFLDRKAHMPFAPFLCLGAIICLFWGNEIIDYYWNCLALGMCNYGI